jgi:hypothetical protein
VSIEGGQENMYRKSGLFNKFLVTGIIIIFLCVSIQPVIALIQKNEVIQHELNNYSVVTGWSEEIKIVASDGESRENFGQSVSIDGDYAIIGTCRDNDNGGNSGSAYIFKRSGMNWTQQAKLLALDGKPNDCFGWSVSISGDYAIIGAFADDNNKGSAYIFKREDSNWTEQQKLLALDGDEVDNFGYSVSISGDYAIVGAYCHDHNVNGSGSAYIFKRYETAWLQETELISKDIAEGDHFGYSVSINEDYIVIGAPWDDNIAKDSGAAYVFKCEDSNWTQQAKLLPQDGAKNDFFGGSVSINGDYIVIGAPVTEDNGYRSGSAYIFKRLGKNWIQQAKLLPKDGSELAMFGFRVSINCDYVLIGAYGEKGWKGSAYVFRHDDTSWIQEQKLTASDGESGDFFACSVSIDNDYAIIGADWDDDMGDLSGSAYIFSKNGINQPPNIPNINGPNNGKPGDEYTYSIYVSDPENDNIYILWNWGDGNNSDWLGPYESGTELNNSYIWNMTGTFIIKIILRDEHGAIKTAYKKITIARTRESHLWYHLLNMFPVLEKLLRLIKVI